MGNSLRVPPAPASSPRKRRRRPPTGPLLAVMNGALAGLTGVYLSTHSVLVTLMAAAVAVTLAILLLLGG
jgi:hypothetical protein